MENVNIDNHDETLLEESSAGKQYFFFKAGGDIYAIEAQYVNEMLEYQHITKVPMMPNYIKGVTNIRGDILAVVDLLERFELGTTEISKKTALVIVNDIALIIDEVYEVNIIADEDIKASLDFGFKIKQRFITNMARYTSRDVEEYIAILNCEEILNIKELSQIKDLS
jgi:purine-binding chemotaxis protein CheW